MDTVYIQITIMNNVFLWLETGSKLWNENNYVKVLGSQVIIFF